MSQRPVQLVYCSRQRIDPRRLDLELAGIVQASVRNNRASDVTGLLLAHAGWFLQVLEGAPAQLKSTYARIIDDRRHIGCQVLSATPIGERQFGDWNMCARRLTREDDAILGVLALRDRFDPSRFDAKTALGLLLAVRNIRDRLSLNSPVGDAKRAQLSAGKPGSAAQQIPAR